MGKIYSDLLEAVNMQKNFKAVIFDMDGLVLKEYLWNSLQ